MVGTTQLTSVDDPRLTPPQKHVWQDDAACAQVGPYIFFPSVGGSTLDAKAVCAGCDVIFTCLEFAMKAELEETHGDLRNGIFGGLSGLERKALFKLMQNDSSMTLEEGYNVVVSKRAQKGPKRSKVV